MKRLSSVLCTGLVVACTDATLPADPAPESSSEPAPGPLPDDTGLPLPCVDIVHTSPAEDESGVFYRAPLRVDLSDDGRGVLQFGNFASQLGEQTAAAVAWSPDGRRALLSRPSPLSPQTPWSLLLSTGCEPTLASFTTSSTGQPIATASVAGRSYQLDPSPLRGLLPALDDHALRAAADQVLPTMALHVESWSATARSYQIAFFGDRPSPDHPDPPRVITRPAPQTGWQLTENPFVQLDVTGDQAQIPLLLAGPLGLAVPFLDLPTVPDHRAPVQVDRIVLSGAFSADRTRIEGLRLKVQADARQLAQALADQGLRVSPGQLCTGARRFGARCQPCPDGFVSCLTSDIDGLEATWNPDLGL